jgi:ribosome biogenesis protein Tsr3
VQENGCWALATLASNEANQVKIAELTCIEAVLAAMNAHFDSADVQENGCWALATLASNEANQVKIAELGGNEAVVAAMNLHRDSIDVQQQGQWALNRKTWAHGKTQAKAKQLGVVVGARDVLDAFSQ